MAKLRKQRRKKVYRHNVNRKRLRNKIFSKGNIDCKEIKNAWDERKSVQTNLKEMGLCYDPNQTFKVESLKKKRMKLMSEVNKGWMEESVHEEETKPITKPHVLKELIDDATAPRERRFRLPKGQVERLSNLLTTYGLNYKAMARDKNNYNQETWRQIRSKIKRFLSIPEQYTKFLASASAETLKKLEENEVVSDDN